MRARYPDREGHVESRGVRVFWEEYGGGDRAVVFVPPWQITHSRIWKMQLAYFARYFRVIVFDMPGNGRSEHPLTGYRPETEAAHTLAVMDATGTPRASLVCLSRSACPRPIGLEMNSARLGRASARRHAGRGVAPRKSRTARLNRTG